MIEHCLKVLYQRSKTKSVILMEAMDRRIRNRATEVGDGLGVKV